MNDSLSGGTAIVTEHEGDGRTALCVCTRARGQLEGRRKLAGHVCCIGQDLRQTGSAAQRHTVIN